MTELDLIAEIDQIMSDITGINGIAPPENWVVAELMRRHSVDLGEHPNAELIMRCAIAGFRGTVRERLGLPWDEDQMPAESRTPEELREEAERRFRHADELERYQQERPSIPKQ
jgi:hypothetical protein